MLESFSDIITSQVYDLIAQHLIVAGGDALLVVARGLVVGVDDSVRSDTVGVVRLSPGVDGVDVCGIRIIQFNFDISTIKISKIQKERHTA
jgi:hypothetical protein